jgi:hypothetical protein
MDDARGVLDLFKEYFEDEGIKKVLLSFYACMHECGNQSSSSTGG